MAADTGAPVTHDRVLCISTIANDSDRRIVNAPPVPVDDEVSLQPVGQRKNHFTTIGMQINRIHENVLPEPAAGEVIAFPKGTESRRTAFDGPIVPRYRRIAKTEAARPSLLDV